MASSDGVPPTFPCRLLCEPNSSQKESRDTLDYRDYACKKHAIMDPWFPALEIILSGKFEE